MCNRLFKTLGVQVNCFEWDLLKNHFEQRFSKLIVWLTFNRFCFLIHISWQLQTVYMIFHTSISQFTNPYDYSVIFATKSLGKKTTHNQASSISAKITRSKQVSGYGYKGCPKKVGYIEFDRVPVSSVCKFRFPLLSNSQLIKLNLHAIQFKRRYCTSKEVFNMYLCMLPMLFL